MKNLSKYLTLFFCLVILSSCNQKPKIAIVGIGIECSTFSPARTTLDMFKPRYGEDVFKAYPFIDPERADWLPAMLAWTTPGGMVTREAYDTLVNQSLRLLRKNMPKEGYDGLFLDIHGAMSVEGLDDPEGDYILKIREIVGKNVIISASMDPHGCVSHTLAKNVDLITAYRMSPHTDRYISRERALENLLYRLENNLGKPQHKAWVKIPILLPGEKTSTRVEPGKSLYEAIPKVIAKGQGQEIIDAAIWMSYPWADEPRNHAVVMVVGDNKQKVEQGAKDLAEHFWSIREDFEFVAPTTTLDKALSNALSSKVRPYFISDMGDNPTAGGAGDVTWTLDQLLKHKKLNSVKNKRLIYASIPGPAMVAAAKKVGIGGIATAEVGAMVDDRYCGPIKLKGKVETILDNGDNDQVVIRIGNIQVIVTESRQPFHYKKDFDRLGLKPEEADIIVVKLGYLTEELYEMRADWCMAHTRGGVDQELTKLPYRRLERPIYPLDPDMPDPELEVVFIAPSKPL